MNLLTSFSHLFSYLYLISSSSSRSLWYEQCIFKGLKAFRNYLSITNLTPPIYLCFNPTIHRQFIHSRLRGSIFLYFYLNKLIHTKQRINGFELVQQRTIISLFCSIHLLLHGLSTIFPNEKQKYFHQKLTRTPIINDQEKDHILSFDLSIPPMSAQREHHIRELAKRKDITEQEEILNIIKAIQQDKFQYVQDLFTPKQWTLFKIEVGKPRVKKSLLFFRHPLSPSSSNSTSKAIKVIIIGPCGNGKTTLVNILSGSELQAGMAASSLTRNVTELKSKINYDLPFVIYDSPGTTAHKEKLDHAVHLKALLEYKPINTVFVLVKFDQRMDETLTVFSRHKKMLSNCQNIVFVVTHIDILPKMQEIQQSIALLNKAMSEIHMDNQVVYLSNKLIDEKTLSDSLYHISRSLPQVSIKINEMTFFKYFNMKKDDIEEMYFQEFEKELVKEMEEITKDYQSYAASFSKDADRDSIFQDMMISLRNQLIDVLEEFEKKYQNTMMVTEKYSSHYTLQMTINEMISFFQETIRKFHTNDLFQSQFTGKIDIRDLIKQCPNCHEVWFRVEACANSTCGNRPSCAFDFIKKSMFKYTFFRDRKNKKFSFQKKDFTNSTIKNLSGDSNLQKKIKDSKKIGCGARMNFDMLPRLPKIEEALMEWYNCTSMEQVVASINTDTQMNRIRGQLQNKVKSDFQLFKH